MMVAVQVRGRGGGQVLRSCEDLPFRQDLAGKAVFMLADGILRRIIIPTAQHPLLAP